MDKNYTILHCHTSLSNAFTTIDSVTTFQNYIDEAINNNMNAIAFSEHGSVLEWYHKKQSVEKSGMKYIHASEVYVTRNKDEKIRDNFHCLLIATNYESFKELNKLISNSFNREDGHFYYSPRITYDELKALSKDIIICTACIGGIFGKGDKDIQEDFLKFIVDNKDRCYLEIQHHLTPIQIEYNNRLIKMSKKYGLNLVATTDTHCLNEKHVKGRGILQKSKNIFFDDEDGWDLTFKTYEQLCECFDKQGVDKDIYLKAIENTNIIAEKVVPFELNKDTKYPKIYDNSIKEFKKKVNIGYHSNQYIKERHSFEDVQKILNEELDVYKKTKSIDFMLLQAYLREWEIENDILCGYGRGSVSGSLIAYLLNITNMDSLKFGLNFFRFQNPSRVTNCDIDTDYYSKDRDKVKEFILKDRMNIDNIQSSEIITFNTIATKGAIRDVCRALYSEDESKSYLDISNYISSNVEANEDNMRDEHPEVFEYVDIINGTIMSIGSHPSGVLITDNNIDEDIGSCTLATSKYPVSMLNMKELDDLMYVKLNK